MITYEQAEELKRLGVEQEITNGSWYYLDKVEQIDGPHLACCKCTFSNPNRAYHKSHSIPELKAAIAEENIERIVSTRSAADKLDSRYLVECYENFSLTAPNYNALAPTEDKALADILIQILREKKGDNVDGLTQKQAARLDHYGVNDRRLEDLLQAIEAEGYKVASYSTHHCEVWFPGKPDVDEIFCAHPSRLRNAADALIWVLQEKQKDTCGTCASLRVVEEWKPDGVCCEDPDVNHTFNYAGHRVTDTACPNHQAVGE